MQKFWNWDVLKFRGQKMGTNFSSSGWEKKGGPKFFQNPRGKIKPYSLWQWFSFKYFWARSHLSYLVLDLAIKSYSMGGVVVLGKRQNVTSLTFYLQEAGCFGTRIRLRPFIAKLHPWSALGCSKMHQSCLIKLHMQILDPFDLKTLPEFFQEF